MTGAVPPSWARALTHLQEGDPDAARRALDAEEDGNGVAGLLRSLLEGPRAPAGPLPDPVPVDDDPEARLARALAAMLEAGRALREGRVEALLERSQEAERLAGLEWPWLVLRLASLHQAAFRFSGRAEPRDRAIGIATTVADRLDLPHMAILARGVLATVHVLEADLHLTLDRCTAGIDLAAATGLADHPVVALSHQFRAYALFEWNRLDEARADLERAWSLAGERGHGVRSGVARTMAALESAAGHGERSDEWFARLESVVGEPMTLRNREWLAAVRVLQGVRRRADLRAIDRWRRAYTFDDPSDTAERDPASRLHELSHLATVLEATSQWESLLAVADTLAEGSRPLRRGFEAQALAARATALEALGRHAEADATMAEALEAGERGGLVRTFVAGAPERRTLLERACTRGSEPARRVLGAAPEPDGEGPRLTPRQVEVLDHVAAGLSNREIAHVLFVSEATVKTHLREVFKRLRVRSRTRAVAVAGELGLIRRPGDAAGG